MAAPNTPNFEKVHALAIGVVEGTLPSAQLAELQELLANDAEAGRLYLEHMQESACLTWVCANESDLLVERKVSLFDGGRVDTANEAGSGANWLACDGLNCCFWHAIRAAQTGSRSTVRPPWLRSTQLKNE